MVDDIILSSTIHHLPRLNLLLMNFKAKAQTKSFKKLLRDVACLGEGFSPKVYTIKTLGLIILMFSDLRLCT